MKKAFQTKQSLLSLLKGKVQKLRFFDILGLSLFGSLITAELDADGDVDILTEFDSPQQSDDSFSDLSSFVDFIGEGSNDVDPN
jgi:predicted nucleotidyltransferase